MILEQHKAVKMQERSDMHDHALYKQCVAKYLFGKLKEVKIDDEHSYDELAGEGKNDDKDDDEEDDETKHNDTKQDDDDNDQGPPPGGNDPKNANNDDEDSDEDELPSHAHEDFRCKVCLKRYNDKSSRSKGKKHADSQAWKRFCMKQRRYTTGRIWQ